jgi:hypothetical protein
MTIYRSLVSPMFLPGAIEISTLVARPRTIQVVGQLSRRPRSPCRGATWSKRARGSHLHSMFLYLDCLLLCMDICICEKQLCYPFGRREAKTATDATLEKKEGMIPLSTRAARKKTEFSLLSYSRQRLPRPARLYSSPTNRANAPVFDSAASSIPDSYPAFLPAHPKFDDPTKNVPDDPSNNNMHTFLQSRTPYTILPPPLPLGNHSELNNVLYTDSPTRDRISIMDACLHNGHDVPRAKEIFDNLRASGAKQIIHSRLYLAFVEAYLDMAFQQPEQRSLWVEDAWTLLDSLFSGNENVSVNSGTYALALVAWLRCVYVSPWYDFALIVSQILV